MYLQVETLMEGLPAQPMEHQQGKYSNWALIICAIRDSDKALELTYDDEIVLFNSACNDKLEEDLGENKDSTDIVCYYSSYHNINCRVYLFL